MDLFTCREQFFVPSAYSGLLVISLSELYDNNSLCWRKSIGEIALYRTGKGVSP